eukprot:CAMPEP_0176421728 /NCGR_PEP_ID=MMETSP0127-20121128/9340_1 /TAXON_ID=938130 /ORGANISM="Platyophrya macrostoma, Strain WH" /LENGTH=59 /DNA_ID=CAMNT_0017802501 /DNA_START=292 /DNA_END=471 /DNA_ORIENTATION=+
MNYAASHNDAQPELLDVNFNGAVHANDTNPLLSPDDVGCGVPIATYQQSQPKQYSQDAV